ncbi:MAG: type II toxin-antitoxin system HicB family antitoxin [Bryobacteraceae bacterium]
MALLHTDEGFSVWVPGLPGCASQGQTETEALDNIRDAIDEYLTVADELSGDAEKREVVLQRQSMAIAGVPHQRAVRRSRSWVWPFGGKKSTL